MKTAADDTENYEEIEDVEEPLTHEEWLEEMAASGRDTREFDPAYFCLRRENEAYDLSAIFVKKATLRHITRIEALRWEAEHKLARLLKRVGALYREVFATGGECFIPPGSPTRFKSKTTTGQPRRLSVEKSRYSNGELSSTYDDEFWEFKPTKHKGTEMEVLAGAIEEGEWEQVILPDRIARSKDPVKLELGRRWRHMEIRTDRMRGRCGLLSDLLKSAVELVGILPQGPASYDTRVMVEINGRHYEFQVRGDRAHNVDQSRWPRPSDPSLVIVTDTFSLDESIVGKSREAVQIRLGEPLLVEDDHRTWRYREGTVRFGSGPSDYYSKVVAVDTTPNDIPAVARKSDKKTKKKKTKKR